MTAAPPVAVTRPERPYPGLRPFEVEEWAIFFGRERMIDEVIGRLAGSRLVLIHGISGSGKSSLVRAGVLPKLALQYGRHDAPWRTCAMRPSGGPLWNLAFEFANLEGRGEDLERVSTIAGQLNASSATLASVAGSLDGVKDKSLCLLVDQFEELFRYERETSRDEAELFVDLIQRAAADAAREAAAGGVDLHVSVPCARNSSANARVSPASPRRSTAPNISCRGWTTKGSRARCGGRRRCMARSLTRASPSG
ncbi:MAG: ATP-binding protein [Hyphomicrobiales bacterium]|nr:ATP-binding protein [Hyphomicrobiales bacterium]